MTVRRRSSFILLAALTFLTVTFIAAMADVPHTIPLFKVALFATVAAVVYRATIPASAERTDEPIETP